MSKTRVLIVEDSQIVCDSLMRRLESMEGYLVAAALSNAANAELLCLRGDIDLILMDVCTADNESGLEAAARIKKRYPQIRIIVITSMPELSFLKKAREAGCESFWYKEGDQDLRDVIRRTMAGESVYPPRVPEVPLGNIPGSALTEREISVIRELAAGLSYREIAERIGITENTVKYHVKNLLQKTGFKNSLQLVVEAVDRKLILPKY